MQIIFRPRFPLDVVAVERPDASHPRAEEAVRRWTDLFGPARRTADFEDFHENACQLLAAFDSGLPVFVMAPDGANATAVAHRFHTDAAAPLAGEPTLLIGCQIQFDPYRGSDTGIDLRWPDRERAATASRYWANPAFRQAAGRRLESACYHGCDAPDDLTTVTQRLGREGGGPLLVKIVAQNKYGPLETIEMADWSSRAAVDRALFEAFDFSLVHLEGRADGFLVQDKVVMGNEYRVVVVDGVPVAGAGCVEALCPAYNDGVAFHPAVERRRNDGAVVLDPGLAERYEEAADAIAARMAAADPRMIDYTLDLATLPDGRIVAIECNPLQNYGFYAMDWGRVFQAMRTAVEDRVALEPGPAATPVR